jgi:uncharacterized membrane protein YdjX (TVP38/TMEM64 family)
MLHHRHHLISYIIVLRLTPVFPGWFLNIAAPHVGVPVLRFVVGTMLGILPTTFLYVEAGETLERFSHSDNDASAYIFSSYNLLLLSGIGVAALIPPILARYLSK